MKPYFLGILFIIISIAAADKPPREELEWVVHDEVGIGGDINGTQI